MTELFQIITLVFLASILALSIWNLYILKTIKRSGFIAKNSDKELFFDLKYRIQLITTIFSIVIAILAYFGLTTQERINDTIQTNIDKEFKKYDSIYVSLNLKRDSAFNSIKLINKQVKELNAETDSLTNDIDKKILSFTIIYNNLQAKRDSLDRNLTFVDKQIDNLLISFNEANKKIKNANADVNDIKQFIPACQKNNTGNLGFNNTTADGMYVYYSQKENDISTFVKVGPKSSKTIFDVKAGRYYYFTSNKLIEKFDNSINHINGYVLVSECMSQFIILR